MEDLSLNFFDCGLQPEGLRLLTERIVDLKQMKHLDLNLGSNNRISSESMVSLSLMLKKYPYL